MEEVVIIGDTRIEGLYTEQAVNERKVETVDRGNQDFLGSSGDDPGRRFVSNKSKEDNISELLNDNDVLFSYKTENKLVWWCSNLGVPSYHYCGVVDVFDSPDESGVASIEYW